MQDRTALVMGKGRRQRLIFWDDVAWAAVMDYLDMRGDWSNGEPVFIRYDRNATNSILPLSTASVRNVVSRLAVEAGLNDHIHPHAFRHRVATKVLTATGDLAAAQDILGHASPNTTRIYTKLAGGRLRAALDAADL